MWKQTLMTGRPHGRPGTTFFVKAVSSAIAMGAALFPDSADAQQPPAVTVGGLALQQLEPSPAGDPLFSVPSPSIGGHLTPRAMVMFDYAHNPLRLFGTTEAAIVSSQAFLRIDASLPLWDRLLVSLDMPFAIVQKGNEPSVPDVSFHTPTSAAPGDLRIGARGRLFGDDQAPFQTSLGAYFFVPTGPSGSYSGEGAVRVAPHAIVGGQISSIVPVVWSITAGSILRGSDNPHTLTFGAGAAAQLWENRIRIGPEFYGALPFTDKPMLSASGATVTSQARFNAEVLLGARFRLYNLIEIGAAGGPGLSRAIGTPTYRLLAHVAWSPGAPEKTSTALPADRDGDGILDAVDVCPNAKGIESRDRTRNGCPKADRDGDGVLDTADACPAIAGQASIDATKNGCPPDRDGDGIADAVDACPDTKGSSSEDPNRNGCANDRDGDGILDLADACPYVKGERNADRLRNGCPEDVDADGLKPPDDACPFERGARDPDPNQNGCPKFVRVKGNEIVLLAPIRFMMYGRMLPDAEPLPEGLAVEVREVIDQHPEIKTIEVQGHADDAGDPEFNTRISQERADAVRWWLIEAGIPKDKLVAKGLGDTSPIANNKTPEGRQKNRRVQLMIVERFR